MEWETVRCVRMDGSILSECYAQGAWSLRFEDRSGVRHLTAYSLETLEQKKTGRLWNGACPEELLGRGRDLLGEQVLAHGEPDWETVRGLLPPLTREAYCFLSGTASWGGVVVDPMGQIYPQCSGTQRQPDPLFAPVMVDGELGELPPRQVLLDGMYPVLYSVHRGERAVLELSYFVEPGDPDRDPIVWVRAKRYAPGDPEHGEQAYYVAAASRHTNRKIEPETYWAALADTVAYWLRFAGDGAQLSLPEKPLQRVVYGSLMACATTFTADHAHYGHLRYGAELHDHFPPNYLWTLEACLLWGKWAWARRIWQHLMVYVLNDYGRFVYRQGDHEFFGASAEEYGQLLFLAERYGALLEMDRWPEDYWSKLTGMGEILLAHCVASEETGGRPLIAMCAEADTNTRVHAYLNNNLWGVRGLYALGRLLRQHGRSADALRFERRAAQLLADVRLLLERERVDSPYGPLVPFRIGYAPLPFTLSSCEDASAPLSEEQRRVYGEASDYRVNPQGGGQDLTENTYANYRYYPEILSAMLLKREEAEALVAMREALGGELLGMTRFYSWLDDWPVTHYARYLLESGRIEKYLLLLYAHTAHHGSPELMCYYEQVSADGGMVAPDCVPSLLTTAILTAWAFAYEAVEDGALTLLGAVPKTWMRQGFSVRGLGYSGGTLSVSYRENRLRLSFSPPCQKTVRVSLRDRPSLSMEEIRTGREWIESVDGCCLVLKSGIASEVELVLTEPRE